MKTNKLLTQIGLSALVCTLIMLAGFSARVSAQEAPARAFGGIKDEMGRPVPGVSLSFKNAMTGQTYDTNADTFGQYSRPGLPPGNYSVTLKQKDMVIYMSDEMFTAGQEAKLDFDFKEIHAKEEAEAAEAAKKAAEYREKFAAMKVHFDAAVAALDQAKAQRTAVEKLPKDQQAAAQSQVTGPATTAATEFQAAIEGTPDTDPNRAVLFARLGEAYDIAGKYPDSASAYQKAVAIKPDPGTYNNLGNALARTGKVDDALAAYQKAIAMDPQNTAMYWRNLAVGLYNSGRIKESVEPLKKATEADPKSAQAWYLLGAALVNTMEFKQEGEKLIPTITPGTTEAYQHAIDLDPNGPFGAQAKQGLAELQAMGLGVDTKIGSAPPAKKAPAKK